MISRETQDIDTMSCVNGFYSFRYTSTDKEKNKLSLLMLLFINKKLRLVHSVFINKFIHEETQLLKYSSSFVAVPWQ